MRRNSSSGIKFRRPSLSSASSVGLPLERPKPLASAVKSLGRKVQGRDDGGQFSPKAFRSSLSSSKGASSSPQPTGGSNTPGSRSQPSTLERSPYDASLLSPASTTIPRRPSSSRSPMSPSGGEVTNMDTCGLQKNRKFRNALIWFHTTPDKSEVLFSANIHLVTQEPEKLTKKRRKSSNAAAFNTAQSIQNLEELQKVLLLTEYSVVIYDRKAKKIMQKYDIQSLSDISRSDRADYFVIHFPMNQDDDILINCPHRDAFLELLCQRYEYLHELGSSLPVDTGNNFTVFRQKGHFDVVLNEPRKRFGLKMPLHRIEWKTKEGGGASVLSITRFTGGSASAAARNRPASMMVDTSSLQQRKDSGGSVGGLARGSGGYRMPLPLPLDVAHSCPADMPTPLVDGVDSSERFSFGSTATSSTLSSVTPLPQSQSQDRSRRSSSIKSTTSSAAGLPFNLPPPQAPSSVSRPGQSSSRFRRESAGGGKSHRRSGSVGSNASRSSAGSAISNLSRQSSALSAMSGDDNHRDLRSPSSRSYSSMTFGGGPRPRPHLRQLSVGSAQGDDLLSVTSFTGTGTLRGSRSRRRRSGGTRQKLADINFSEDLLAADVLEMPRRASPRSHNGRVPSILPQRSRGVSVGSGSGSGSGGAQQASVPMRHQRRKSIRERTNELFGKKSLGDRLKSLVTSKSNRSSPDRSRSPRRKQSLKSASLSAALGSMPRRASRDRGSSGGGSGATTPKQRGRRFSLKSPGLKKSDSNTSLNSSEIPSSYIPRSMKSSPGSNSRTRRKSVHNGSPQTSMKRSLMKLSPNSNAPVSGSNTQHRPPLYAVDSPSAASPPNRNSQRKATANADLPSQNAPPPASTVNADFPSQVAPSPLPLDPPSLPHAQSMYAEPGTPRLGKASPGTPSRSSTMYVGPSSCPQRTYSPLSKCITEYIPQEGYFAALEVPSPLARSSSSSRLPSEMPSTPTQSTSMHAQPPTVTRALSTESFQCATPSRVRRGPTFAPPTPRPFHVAPTPPETPMSKGSDRNTPNSRGGSPRVQRLNSSPVPSPTRSPRPMHTPRMGGANGRLKHSPSAMPRFSRMRPPPNKAERFTFEEILETCPPPPPPPPISPPKTPNSGRRSTKSQKAKRSKSTGGDLSRKRSDSAQSSSSWKSLFNALTESPSSFPQEFDAPESPRDIHSASSPHERAKHTEHKNNRSATPPDNKLSPKSSGVTHLRLFASGPPGRPNGLEMGSSSAPPTPTNAAVPWTLFHRKPGYKEFVVESSERSPRGMYHNPNDLNIYGDSAHTDAEHRCPPSRGEDANKVEAHHRLPRLSLSVTSTRSAPQMASPRVASGGQQPPKRPSLRLKRPSLRLLGREELADVRRESVESDSRVHVAAPSSSPGARLRLASLGEDRGNDESSFFEEKTELQGADPRDRGASAPFTDDVTTLRASEPDTVGIFIDEACDTGHSNSGARCGSTDVWNANGSGNSHTGGNNPIQSSVTADGNSTSAPPGVATDGNSCPSDIDNATNDFDKARNVFLSVTELDNARTKARASHRVRSSRANFRLRVRPQKQKTQHDQPRQHPQSQQKSSQQKPPQQEEKSPKREDASLSLAEFLQPSDSE